MPLSLRLRAHEKRHAGTRRCLASPCARPKAITQSVACHCRGGTPNGRLCFKPVTTLKRGMWRIWCALRPEKDRINYSARLRPIPAFRLCRRCSAFSTRPTTISTRCRLSACWPVGAEKRIAEDAREGGAVGDVEEAQRADVPVQFERRDVVAEQAGLAAAAADRFKLLDGAGVEQPDQLGLLEIGAVMDVLDHHDADEIRMAAVMVEGELGEPLERLDRRQVVELELLLAGADLPVGLLQHAADRARPCRRNSSRSSASTCASWPRSRRCARRTGRWRRTRPSPPQGCSSERPPGPASSRCGRPPGLLVHRHVAAHVLLARPSHRPHATQINRFVQSC